MPLNIPDSVYRFFHGIIDYAGLFPPASLDLQNAFANYADYLKGENSWMLSKFVCPFSMTNELSEELGKVQFPDNSKVRLSMIATPAKNSGEFASGLRVEINNMLKKNGEIAGNGTVESIELRLPDELASGNDKDEIAGFLDSISRITKESFSNRVFLFLEIPGSGDFNSIARHSVQAIERHNESFNDAGFKLRTGGTSASDFPDASLIVHIIRLCLNHKVMTKFTAGMHHPFRHYDTGISSYMHGFVNVFGAGILAFRHAVSDHELKNVILEEDSSRFRFTADSFEWDKWKCGVEEMHGARNGLVLSFGSCSFEEPLDDLIKAGILQNLQSVKQ